MLFVRAGLTALFAAMVLTGAACGTDALGRETCQRIEQARCRKAPGCADLGVVDVEACNAFARDRCLHGLSVEEPTVARVDQCVRAIDEATSCAIVASPELDPACSFLSPDSFDSGADSSSAVDASDAGSPGADAESGATSASSTDAAPDTAALSDAAPDTAALSDAAPDTAALSDASGA